MLTVRRAGIDDIEKVVDLRMTFLQDVHPDEEPDPALLAATHHYVAEKLPSGEFLVWFVEEDQRIVGMGGLVFWHRPPTSHCQTHLHAYVLNMYTVPEQRGRGVATMLLEHITDFVRTTTPARRVTLHATEMGKSVYERFGFLNCSDEMKLEIR